MEDLGFRLPSCGMWWPHAGRAGSTQSAGEQLLEAGQWGARQTSVAVAFVFEASGKGLVQRREWKGMGDRRGCCVDRYEGNVEDLALDFTLEEEVNGKRRIIELRPGGASLPVTDANKLLYVHLVVDWHMNGKLGAPAAAFARGMHQVRILHSHPESALPFSFYSSFCLFVCLFARFLLGGVGAEGRGVGFLP